MQRAEYFSAVSAKSRNRPTFTKGKLREASPIRRIACRRVTTDGTSLRLMHCKNAFSMQMLQSAHTDLAVLTGGDAVGSGASRRQCGNGRNVVRDRGAADSLLVKEWIRPVRSVHDQLNAVTFYEIDHVGAPFLHLEDTVDDKPGLFQNVSGAV